MPPHLRAAAALAALLSAAPAAASDLEPRLTLADPGASARTVALTLDACSGATDHRVLDLLIAERIPATVFVTRRWLNGNAAALKLLLAHRDLFEIENHGDAHVPAITDRATMFGIRTAGSLEAVRREVEGGAAAIEAATGSRPRWYRDATARYSRDALAAIRADGYAIAGYSLNADMGASLMAPMVARRVAAAKNGDVIIAHVNQPGRAAGSGLAEGLRTLKASGARFVLLRDAETRTDDGPAIGPVVARNRPSGAAQPASSLTPR
ncbi:polysaccharide deacetylase family protein [Methylopila henanensis]|uniref:Chitooligosaccharide deacetylase n=1 Tax=Methylopila henanensis TaxID=873516 RepID=A0ABW4K3R2_9HYPH